MKLKREPKVNYPILNICKEYSDENHLLNEEKIQKYLLNDYAMDVDKEIVHESLKLLIETGIGIKRHSSSFFYDQRTFTYEDVKKHYFHIKQLSIEQSVKDGIINKMMNELSVYQRKKLKDEIAYDMFFRS